MWCCVYGLSPGRDGHTLEAQNCYAHRLMDTFTRRSALNCDLHLTHAHIHASRMRHSNSILMSEKEKEREERQVEGGGFFLVVFFVFGFFFPSSPIFPESAGCGCTNSLCTCILIANSDIPADKISMRFSWVQVSIKALAISEDESNLTWKLATFMFLCKVSRVRPLFSCACTRKVIYPLKLELLQTDGSV